MHFIWRDSPSGCILYGGTVPPGCVLSGGTVPPFNLSLFFIPYNMLIFLLIFKFYHSHLMLSKFFLFIYLNLIHRYFYFLHICILAVPWPARPLKIILFSLNSSLSQFTNTKLFTFYHAKTESNLTWLKTQKDFCFDTNFDTYL